MTVLDRERLIHLREVPRHLPRRNGKAVHIATVYRWAHRGCRGRKLETFHVGGILFTSCEALERFLQPPEDLPPALAPRPGPAPRPDQRDWFSRLPAWRRRQIEQAERELERAGF